MRVLVMDNPRSGQGSAGLYAFVRELVEADAEVVVRALTPGGPEPGFRDEAAAFDAVVSGGGDGTVSSLAYALRDTGIPLLAYPAGTANLLALNLGLPSDPRTLARIVLEGRTRTTDLGQLRFADGTERGFAIIAGAGFDAKVMEGAADTKATLGPWAYLVSVMANLTPTLADFRIWLDGELLATDGIAVICVNFAKIPFDLAVTPANDAADGLLEVAVVRTRHVAALLPAVWQAMLERLGQASERSGLEIHRAREIRVESDPPLPLQYDGEVANEMTPFTACVLPGAATLLVES